MESLWITTSIFSFIGVLIGISFNHYYTVIEHKAFVGKGEPPYVVRLLMCLIIGGILNGVVGFIFHHVVVEQIQFYIDNIYYIMLGIGLLFMSLGITHHLALKHKKVN